MNVSKICTFSNLNHWVTRWLWNIWVGDFSSLFWIVSIGALCISTSDPVTGRNNFFSAHKQDFPSFLVTSNKDRRESAKNNRVLSLVLAKNLAIIWIANLAELVLFATFATLAGHSCQRWLQECSKRFASQQFDAH